MVVSCLIALYAGFISFILLASGCPRCSMAKFFPGNADFDHGSLGILLGVLVRGELEGFFVIIMVSLIDTGIQNPIGNPAANKDFVMGFPAFAPTQLAVAGGFTHVLPWVNILISLVWLAGFTLLGLLIFYVKTKAWNVRQNP